MSISNHPQNNYGKNKQSMKEFFVANYRVDMGRCQIIDKDAIVAMEPKVLQVLLILAENQGQVVSHETLLNKVWPNVQVAPNALQRCIAQLRKAFNDDAKNQRVITTHPKIGYSLIADVNWQGQFKKETAEAPINQGSRWLMGLGVLSLSLIFLSIYLIKPIKNELPVQHLTALTSTDNKEFSPTFSPDGRYIAFQRYLKACENQLWALDLKDNREYLLTKDVGIYGTPSWSPDGQQLAFSSITVCGEERELKGCKEIRAISFALAKSSPQNTRQLLACDKQDYFAAVWLTNDKIAFFAEEEHQSKLQTLSLKQTDKNHNQLALYSYDTPSMQNPYSLAYSENLNQLAIMQHDLGRNSSLLLLDPDSGETKTVELNIPEKFKNYFYWNTNWHPQRNTLIAATGSSLFEIDLNGEMVEHPITTYQGIYDPYFHPDGSQIVAAMGIYDSDIGELSWHSEQTDGDHPDQSKQVTKSQILYRSTLMERDAKYQPFGQHIAFISRRNGNNHIWLATKPDNEQSNPKSQPFQLSQLLENRVEIDNFIWSRDGQLIIYVADRQLYLLNLDGQSQKINTSFVLLDIYQRLQGDKFLLKVIEDQEFKLISFDINSFESKELYTGSTNWAQMGLDQSLFITDESNRFYQVIDDDKQLLIGLEEIESRSNFFHRDDSLFLLDEHTNFWQFSLQAKNKTLLIENMGDIRSIDDLDLVNKRLLFNQAISARKEIVLFK